MKLIPFRMERWQSTYEHRVGYNLSESGVHPLTVDELLALAGVDGDLPGQVRLGYGQSNGSDELRARIAALHPGATDADVLVTTGGAEANFACCWHLMEPGGAAAVMLPNYMQVPGLLENFDVRPLPFHLREEHAWAPDLDELEDALEDGARFILVTNPNNPTGRVLSPGAMDRIAELADAHGAWILADEVYRGAEVEGPETPSFWGRSERVLVTNSLSKAYGLPGLRLGWIVGPADVVAGLWGRTDYTTIAPSTVSDRLATVALEPDTRARILARTRRIIHGNLAALRGWLDARPDLFSYHPPDAGAICHIRYRADVNSSAFAEKLRVAKDVLVVPGDHFGMDGTLRIGFGPPREELMEALERIAEAFAEAGAGTRGALAGD
ncbi:MAG TPA: aminotransferase class I/II-fold pyridoxal phosphate-dependent enzyme [Longimicrobiales bacterium]|nr:aminotransferase class I/II-fold pyridoxal phosphate-dependent enzyme [Longimicrobiales bacterium]